LYRVKLTDIETHEIFYPKLVFIYLELPKFKKKAVELQTPIDKWLYVFRNLETLQEIPEKLKENIFMKFIEQSLIEHLPKIDRKNYQASLKRYRDSYSVLETAVSKGFEKGKVEGIEIGIAERNTAFVIAAHNKGFSISTISELTGLTEAEIKKILEENL
jgi:predicted transposase/invertase (TIGR01784 family)